MLRRILCLGCALALLAGIFPPTAAALERVGPAEAGEALGARLAEIAAARSVTGCSLAVFEGQEILYTASCGTAAVRGGVVTAASDDTKYRIASISKMVSTIAAMTLVDDGAIALDDTLDKLIDERLVNASWPGDKPTLRHLLTHTSGIFDCGAYYSAISTSRFHSLDAILKAQSPFLDAKPGTSYCYTNFGMGLLAAVTEQATGERFYDFADKVLFQPLGLDAGFLTDQVEDKASIAALGSVDPVSWGAMKPVYDRIPLGQTYLLAQGELTISAPDLARVVMILANNGVSGQDRYLCEDIVSRINAVAYREPGSAIVRGLGIQIVENVPGWGTLYGHQGNAYGVISCAFYDPVTHRGFVFLDNAAYAGKRDNEVYSVNWDVVLAVKDYFAARTALVY